MPTINYQSQQGEWRPQPAERTAADWSLLVNAQIRNGILRARDGWRVLARTTSYTAVADPSSPDGFALEPFGKEYAAFIDNRPLGSFLFSGTAGQDWVLSIWNDGDPDGVPWWRVHSATGELLEEGRSLPVAVTNDAELIGPYDQAIATYTFARWYDTVFFCNGGNLWRWEPLKNMRPFVVEAFHNPQSINVGIYLSGTVFGASIVCVHQDSLVLAGFGEGSALSADGIIDINGDGFVSEADATKVGGFALGPNRNQIIATPYTLVVSDPLMPNCFALQGISQIGSQAQVTGLASYANQLCVFSATEMWLITGPAADKSLLSVQPISRTTGCVSPRGLCQTGDNMLLWTGDDGIYAWGGSGAPKMVSDAIGKLWREGVQGFWRWDIAPQSPDPVLVGLPALKICTTTADLCSAVWVAKDEYAAFALSGTLNKEPNDLILCWSPKENQWWMHTHEGATPAWTLTGVAPNDYWAPTTPTRRSAVVGCHSLMVSSNDPGKMFVQGQAFYSYTNYTNVPPDGCLACLDNATDQKKDRGSPPANSRMAVICLSAPIFLGDSDDRVHRRLHLRMAAIRKTSGVTTGDTGDANPLRLYVMVEQGHWDVLDNTQTTTTQTQQNLDSFPDAYLSAGYFWQKQANADATVGKWGGGGQAASTAIKYWLPMDLFDKRVDLSGRVGQWIQLALVKVADGASEPALFLASAAMEVYPGYGPRR